MTQNTTDFRTLEALQPAFFERDTCLVARELLGCYLLQKVTLPSGGDAPPQSKWRKWLIVETEAYTQDDPACHAFGRKTGRAANLYTAPGTAYVYLTYGMHHCVNVVTEPEGVAGAVLLRGLDPLTELSPKLTPLPERTDGPGRLTRALGISRDLHNGHLLTDVDSPSGLYLAAGNTESPFTIVETTRIGISKAVDYPWRYYILNNPWVSVRNKLAESTHRSV